eukprot:Gregarina_sp_Pseudo_9__1936@NODE_2331_length_1036_cov_632_784353_g2147_i0_p1_GENE_NODE_2331_length_1036_cov_632_784353_g2147_i0NODE_2331_length_1036_cov_632_784353_g2147_i0_p1_ORF_typecomplete_len237_score46_87_NODE_2331_length_1036_cov_632_784353_g2147_i0129839
MKCLAVASSFLAGHLAAGAVTSLFYNTKNEGGACPDACPKANAPVGMDDILTCSTQIVESFHDCRFQGYIDWTGSTVPICASAATEDPATWTLDMSPLMGTTLMVGSIPDTAFFTAVFAKATTKACPLYAGNVTASSTVHCGLDTGAILQREPFVTVPASSSSVQLSASNLFIRDSVQSPGFVMETPGSCGGSVSEIRYDDMRMDYTILYLDISAAGLNVLVSAATVLLSVVTALW